MLFTNDDEPVPRPRFLAGLSGYHYIGGLDKMRKSCIKQTRLLWSWWLPVNWNRFRLAVLRIPTQESIHSTSEWLEALLKISHHYTKTRRLKRTHTYVLLLYLLSRYIHWITLNTGGTLNETLPMHRNTLCLSTRGSPVEWVIPPASTVLLPSFIHSRKYNSPGGVQVNRESHHHHFTILQSTVEGSLCRFSVGERSAVG